MHHYIKIIIIGVLFTGLFAEEVVLYPISFEGQKHFDKTTLEDALGVENKPSYAFWKEDNPRIKNTLVKSVVATLESFYVSEGFYDVNVSLKLLDKHVYVKIIENKPVIIKNIEIKSDENITQFIRFKKESIFKAKTFIQSKQEMIAFLLKEGYCSYDLNTKAYVDLKQHRVDLNYQLSKGERCTFGKLILHGLESISEDVIVSRVSALEGEPFSTTLIQETSNNLYGLQAFDSVVINTDRKIYNVIPVEITFAEIQKPYHVEIGAGYDTFVGPRIHGRISKYNFLGDAQKFDLRASWSKKEQLLILSYFQPAILKIFDYSLDLGANIGYSNLEFDGFQEEKSFSKLYLQYKKRALRIKAGMATESINIEALDNLKKGQTLDQAVNEGLFLLAYPYIDVMYDARDSKLNPKYGYYLAGYGEWGLSREEDSSLYLKTHFEARVIHTFSDLTLSAVGKVGILEDTSDKGLPESKYFFGGGAYSNRAYGYREMGVILSKTQDTIHGASSMLNLSVEANYPLGDKLYGALFTDNTMLTDEAYDFGGEIISSVGMGIRYMTPIGPFKLDVGFNANKPSIYGISFQVGQSF